MHGKRYIPLLLFLSAVLILLYTAYPSIGWWDSGYYAACANSLGIPDPGGSILYVLLGRIFAIVFFFVPTIKAITLVSIISTALASVLFYYGLLYILQTFRISTAESVRIWVSFLTALTLPFLYSIWVESYVSRVYTLGLLLTSILFLCAVKIWFSEDEKQKTRLFLLAVFVLGIDFGAHRLSSPFIAILLVLLVVSLRKQLLNYRFWLSIIVVAVASLSLHLYLLIRGQLDPLPDMGNTHSWGELVSWINMDLRGGPSNIVSLFNRRAPLWDYQIKYMYLRYFGWNFLGTRNPGALFGFPGFSFVPFVLGCLGFIFNLARNFKAWVLIFISWLFFSVLLAFYLNVVNGFHNIREIDRLFLPSFFFFLLWVGIGLFSLSWFSLKLLRKDGWTKKGAPILLVGFGLVVLPLNVLLSNWSVCNKSRYYFPEDFGYNILSSCESDAVVFTNGDNDTFPLWFLQSVEGFRTDVTVANVGLLNTYFYMHQLSETGNGFAVDSALTVAPGPSPEGLEAPIDITIPAPSLSGEQSASDSLRVSYFGHDFGGRHILLPQDKIMISFLNKNNWKRPVYFASTVATSNLLGLEEYLANVGIVRELTPSKGVRLVPKKLEENLSQIYRFRSFNDPDVRLDRSTISLYDNFRHSFAELVNYYIDKGDRRKAEQIFHTMGEKLPEWRFSEEQNRFVTELEELLNN